MACSTHDIDHTSYRKCIGKRQENIPVLRPRRSDENANKWIYNIEGVEVWIGSVWLKTESSNGLVKKLHHL